MSSLPPLPKDYFLKKYPTDPIEPESDSLIKDTGVLLAQGGAGVVRDVGALTKMATGDQHGQTLESLGANAADYWRGQLSETQQREMNRSFLPDADTPFSETALASPRALYGHVVQNLPMLAIPAGSAGLAGRGAAASARVARLTEKAIAKRAGLAGAAAGNVAGAGLAAGNVGYETFEAAGRLTPEELETSPFFQEQKGQGKTFEQARLATMIKARDTAGLSAGIVSGILGSYVNHQIGKLIGVGREAGRIKTGLRLGAAESVTEAGQEGSEALARQLAVRDIAGGPALDPHEIAESSVAGAAVGGPLGAGIGLLSPERKAELPRPDLEANLRDAGFDQGPPTGLLPAPEEGYAQPDDFVVTPDGTAVRRDEADAYRARQDARNQDAPLLLPDRSDDLVSFPDGTTLRRHEVESYLAELEGSGNPEDLERAIQIRRNLYGYTPQPVQPDAGLVVDEEFPVEEIAITETPGRVPGRVIEAEDDNPEHITIEPPRVSTRGIDSEILPVESVEPAPALEREGDIRARSGQPFKNKAAATQALNRKKLDGFKPVQVGKAAWVLRRQDDAGRLREDQGRPGETGVFPETGEDIRRQDLEQAQPGQPGGTALRPGSPQTSTANPVNAPEKAPEAQATEETSETAFQPTHETSTGEPVKVTGESGVYENVQGNLIEDNHATPLEPGQRRGAVGQSATSETTAQEPPKPATPSRSEGKTPETASAISEVSEVSAAKKPHPTDLDYNLPKGSVAGGSKEIGELVEQTKNSKDNKKSAVRYRVVDKEEADQLRKILDADTEGYRHVIDNYAIRHIFEHHGNATTELNRGQDAISSEDLKKIPEIIAQPDSVKHTGFDEEGLELIQYTKQYNGTTFYVEEVRTKRRELAAKSLWKTQTPPRAPSEEVPSLTSETPGRNPPELDTTVPPSSQKSKTILEVPEGYTLKPLKSPGKGRFRIEDSRGNAVFDAQGNSQFTSVKEALAEIPAHEQRQQQKKAKAKKSEESIKPTKNAKKKASNTPIKDFGEKIGGARKDIFTAFRTNRAYPVLTHAYYM